MCAHYLDCCPFKIEYRFGVLRDSHLCKVRGTGIIQEKGENWLAVSPGLFSPGNGTLNLEA